VQEASLAEQNETGDPMKYCIQFIIAAILLMLLSSCSSEEERAGEESTQIYPAVEAVQAQYGSLPLEERLSGIVSAANQVDIYPEITATVEQVMVQDGDKVEKGEVLVQLRDDEYRERLRQAEANLRISRAQERQALAAVGEIEAELKRVRVLADKEISSDLELEQLEARLESAEASLELSKARVEQAESAVEEQKEALRQTQITAPVTGTVGQRNVEIGMQATPNMRLFTIGDLSRSKVTVNLTERMLSYIEAGQTVRIYSENLPDTVMAAELSRISPFLGAGNFSTEAEIDVDNPGRLLLPGMFVTTDVLYGESEQATIIPLSAIYRDVRSGRTGVYVAPSFGIESELIQQPEGDEPAPLSNPTDIEFVPVDVIAEGRDAAGVVGINSGEWIVTVGHNVLERDNSGKARIRPTSWQQIIGMQRLRPDDLLDEIMKGNMADYSTSADNPQIGS
jgi:RND family efflux transporter MFP subunit